MLFIILIHFLRNLLCFFLINTVHFRNITEMPCHAMSSFQSEPCHLPCPASKNSRCFWRLQCLQPWPDGVWRQGLESWREFPSARWVRDGTQNDSIHCSGCQGHREQGVMSKRLDQRAQMEGLNTDALTSLLIKVMLSACLFHWQMFIIYLAIDAVMNNTVVHT